MRGLEAVDRGVLNEIIFIPMVNSYKGSILFIYFGKKRLVAEDPEKDRSDRSPVRM